MALIEKYLMISQSLNLAGLLIDFIGVVLLFRYSSKGYKEIYVDDLSYNSSEPTFKEHLKEMQKSINKMIKDINKKNDVLALKSKKAFVLIGFGFFLQLVSGAINLVCSFSNCVNNNSY